MNSAPAYKLCLRAMHGRCMVRVASLGQPLNRLTVSSAASVRLRGSCGMALVFPTNSHLRHRVPFPNTTDELRLVLLLPPFTQAKTNRPGNPT
jgi:hypothetical protein